MSRLREEPGELTQLLRRWSQGDRSAADELMPLVYDDLRQLAQRALSRERPGHTLDATGIVHEAFVRLVERGLVDWQSRGHFLGLVARLMRQILVDHARGRGALKRGGDRHRVTLAEAHGQLGSRSADLLQLDEALERLAALDARKAEIVELRFFGGLTNDEIASHLGLGTATIGREWRRAKAWLFDELHDEH